MGTLKEEHWKFETFYQRMTIKEWRKVLLDGDDRITFQGCCRRLKAKNLGAGVYEISKANKRGDGLDWK